MAGIRGKELIDYQGILRFDSGPLYIRINGTL